MLNEFKIHIKKEKLFSKTDKILLAVSGGIDSIVMCELFQKAKLKFGIAHCNFQLRAGESEADELFVEALAEKYNVQFHSISFDTSAFAKKNKLSIQTAARELRYEWFEEIRELYNYQAVATAHHRDDSIETFFINLVRGTGISGLHGILPKQGKIIRPLLFASKSGIEAFAKKNKLKHREDSSNVSEKYLRNKIRHQLIPLLKELNPAINDTIEATINRLKETEEIYKKQIAGEYFKIVKQDKNSTLISIKELKKLKPLHSYLFEFLNPLGFNSTTTDEIISCLDKQAGKQFFSKTHRLIKDREYLIVGSREKGEGRREKKENDKTVSHQIKKNQKELNAEQLQIHLKLMARTKDLKLETSGKSANLDFDKLKFPLEIRKWEKGDVFYPLGMKGKKKLSDFFIDKKFSLAQKENTWLLTSKGKIVWVIGHRIDDRFRITDKTKKIYFVEQV